MTNKNIPPRRLKHLQALEEDLAEYFSILDELQAEHPHDPFLVRAKMTASLLLKEVLKDKERLQED